MVTILKDNIDINELFSLKRTKQNIKEQKEAKNALIFAQLIIMVFLGLFGIAWSHVNIFYYIFAFSKILGVFSVILLVLVIVFDSDKSVDYWKDPETRKYILRGKMIFSFVKTIKLFIISVAIIFLLHLTGATAYWREMFSNEVPSLVSSYQPTILEGLIIGFILLLSLLASWNAMYWFSGRFLQILRYDSKKQIIKIKISGFVINTIILTIIFWIIFGGIDLAFIGIIEGDSFEGTEFIKTFFEPYVHWIPPLEILPLLILNFIFWLDGKRSFNHRSNLVLL